MSRSNERPLSDVQRAPHGIPNKVYIAGITLYSVFVAIAMWRRGGFIEADTFLIFLVPLMVVIALVLGQTRMLLRDWIPFALVLFGWQLLRGYADEAASGRGFTLHNEDLIAAERALFGGQLPTVVLQRALYEPGQVHWYDVMSTAFWSFHFVLPLAFAFLLWIRDRDLYWKFVRALLVLSFAAFITYVLYPAVPPWLAARYYGTIPESIYMIRDEVFSGWLYGPNVSYVMRYGNPNVVAAMPSLHAAYPTLIFLISIQYWRRVAPLALLYCLCLWFSIVYLGDHYVVDVLAGIVYALATLLALETVGWLQRRRSAGRMAMDRQSTSTAV